MWRYSLLGTVSFIAGRSKLAETTALYGTFHVCVSVI